MKTGSIYCSLQTSVYNGICQLRLSNMKTFSHLFLVLEVSFFLMSKLKGGKTWLVFGFLVTQARLESRIGILLEHSFNQ